MTFFTFLCLFLTPHFLCAKPAVAPLVAGQPFLVFWNAPTQQCHTRHQAPLALHSFNILSNQGQAFAGEWITIFYFDQLGLYPYYTEKGVAVNGGCPQNCSLYEHSSKMHEDVLHALPWPYFSGLAVVDWEEWRPQWTRNWASKEIYQKKSREYQNIMVTQQAAWEFSAAARRFISETLRLGRMLRPTGLWGLYLYPDCYNYEFKKGLVNYTGRCPPLEVQRNDDLTWLFEESRALYPSIYLAEELQSAPQSRLFVRARVQEALRVADLPSSPTSLPVFVYTRPFYSYSLTPLTQVSLPSTVDLMSSIGESAALGASGVVLWGGIDYSRNQVSCCQWTALLDYLERILGPYITNVTMATRLCSQLLCSGRGRCLRRDPSADVYLHLDSQNFRVAVDLSGEEPRVSVIGRLGGTSKARMKADFRCHCYQGWTGEACQRTDTCLNVCVCTACNRMSSCLCVYMLTYRICMLYMCSVSQLY
uniref:Hyaluronidase n=1 Tax=Erpetoichthys calabaricus TaxID=27687 RepID=A0A8C4TPL2_ERPCA